MATKATRAACVEDALGTYIYHTFSERPPEQLKPDDLRAAIAYLIADLGHYVDRRFQEAGPLPRPRRPWRRHVERRARMSGRPIAGQPHRLHCNQRKQLVMSLWSYQSLIEDIVRRARRKALEDYVLQDICNSDYPDLVTDFARSAGVRLTASQRRELEE